MDNSGTLAAAADVRVKTCVLRNSGVIQANGLTLSATDLISTENMKSAPSLDKAASNHTLNGDTGAKGKTTVTASEKLDNRGQFVTDDGLKLNAEQINNSGTVSGGAA